MVLRSDAPVRGATDVGPGDYVKVADGRWKQIVSNTAFGEAAVPRSWTITTADGAELGMYDVNRYAKDGDFMAPAGQLVDDDLRQIVTLALDLAFYRSVADDGGLGPSAWFELRQAIGDLPEAQEYEAKFGKPH